MTEPYHTVPCASPTACRVPVTRPASAPHAGPVPYCPLPARAPGRGRGLTQVVFMALLTGVLAPVAHAAQVCHENQYIAGISASVLSEGESGFFIYEAFASDGRLIALTFSQSNTSATTRILHSIAQNAMNQGQKVTSMTCDEHGNIVSMNVVRPHQ